MSLSSLAVYIDPGTVLIAVVTIIFATIQAFFALKAKRALVATLPMLALALASGALILTAYLGSGWDALGFLILGVLALFLSAVCAVVFIIFRIIGKIIN
jgi:hypothetical protein